MFNLKLIIFILIIFFCTKTTNCRSEKEILDEIIVESFCFFQLQLIPDWTVSWIVIFGCGITFFCLFNGPYVSTRQG